MPRVFSCPILGVINLEQYYSTGKYTCIQYIYIIQINFIINGSGIEFSCTTHESHIKWLPRPLGDVSRMIHIIRMENKFSLQGNGVMMLWSGCLHQEISVVHIFLNHSYYDICSKPINRFSWACLVIHMQHIACNLSPKNQSDLMPRNGNLRQQLMLIQSPRSMYAIFWGTNSIGWR